MNKILIYVKAVIEFVKELRGAEVTLRDVLKEDQQIDGDSMNDMLECYAEIAQDALCQLLDIEAHKNGTYTKEA